MCVGRVNGRRMLHDTNLFSPHTTHFTDTFALLSIPGGFLQAGLFNPWDRALYLSIKEERPFLSKANFVNPFAGVSQTILQRSISAGLYFPLEEIFADRLVSSELFGTTSKEIQNNRTLIALMAGLLAGASNGIIMNPLAAVKYSFWGAAEAERYKTFAETAVEMFKKGGLRIYFVGAAATVSRDLVFGMFSCKVLCIISVCVGCHAMCGCERQKYESCSISINGF